MKKIVYGGSFDMPTNGHDWMTKEASSVFDETVVAIGINPDKKYMFSVDERIDMLNAMTKGMHNVTVVDMGKNYLVPFAASIGANYLLRGIRSDVDFGCELTMRDANLDMDPNISSWYLIPPQNLRKVSSSFVKGLIGYNGWEDVVKRYVPEPVYDKILEKFDSIRTGKVENKAVP
jgi:pantetheine-phosphate adenylyltransferase